MKTLDEVITSMNHVEFCCTNCKLQFDCDEIECFLEDALYYLNILQKMQKAQPVTKGEWDELYNTPLTWDELRTMEAKPVWLESHGDISEFTGWCIVSRALSDRAHFILSHYDDNFLTYEMALPDITFGRDWQVYRKERI